MVALEKRVVQNYKNSFSAPCSKFEANEGRLKLPESIAAFMLMANAGIDDKHRVSMPAAAAYYGPVSKQKDDMSQNASADIVKSVQYETVPSVIRQCKARENKHSSTTTRNAKQGRFGATGVCATHGKTERLQGMKIKYGCSHFRKYGH